MKDLTLGAVVLALACLLAGLQPGCAAADDDDHHERRGHSRREGDFEPVDSPLYREQCGACHFAYQPGLLPAGSWRRLLSGLDEHFGNAVTLDPEARKALAQYLETHAADRSNAERAQKIARSLGGATPLRITEVPYIRHKHDDLPAEVFRRPSVGSLSNCPACHTTAEKGIYEDDYVKLPK
jgi:mono/diheme cytochrome c family protein